VRLVDPARDDRFLEIGAGRGALTLPLAARAAHVTSVEVDAALVERLQPRLPPNVSLVRGDALVVDLEALTPPGTRVVGNLPYYISSPLVRRLLALHAVARDLHLMVQLEVARRVASPPGSREYGILSILSALWADVDLPLVFPPGAFVPPPKVQSAVLRMRFRSEPRAEVPQQHVSSDCCTRPSAVEDEHLKTICKIAMLTSRKA